MTPDQMIAPGQAEAAKGCIHLALFSLASACAAYNITALISRPSRQLALNALVYPALMALEARQAFKHFSNPALHNNSER